MAAARFGSEEVVAHNMIRELPQFVRDSLASPPKAGEGVHHWLFRVARQLHEHLPATEIVTLLENRVQGCGRHVSRKEIEDAVKNSLSCAWQRSDQSTAGFKPAPKWPAPNAERREAVIRDGGGVADLWEASRLRLEDNLQHTEAIIDRLFPGDPLLCCGWSSQGFDTRTREEWRGQLAQLQFIVPSPMTACTGLTKDGKSSSHCLDNTGPRRFLVTEFDQGDSDEHAALLLHLSCP